MVLSTIIQALAAIQDGAEAGDPALTDHLGTMVRGPNYGSFIKGLNTWADTRDVLISLDWQEISHEDLPAGTTRPECRYFRAAAPEGLESFENVATFSEALAAGLPIEVVDGLKPSPETGNPRGIRLVSASANPQPTQVVHLVLGPWGDILVPWTWHPGRLLAPLANEAVPAAESLEAGRVLTTAEGLALAGCGVHLGA